MNETAVASIALTGALLGVVTYGILRTSSAAVAVLARALG